MKPEKCNSCFSLFPMQSLYLYTRGDKNNASLTRAVDGDESPRTERMLLNACNRSRVTTYKFTTESDLTRAIDAT